MSKRIRRRLPLVFGVTDDNGDLTAMFAWGEHAKAFAAAESIRARYAADDQGLPDWQVIDMTAAKEAGRG